MPMTFGTLLTRAFWTAICVLVGCASLPLTRAAARANSAQLLRQSSLGFPARNDKVQEDTARAKAQKLFAEGRQLLAEGTEASSLAALSKFEESLPLWQKVADRRAEAITLSFIGKIYDALGDKQQALDFYNRTLPLLAETRDFRGEAITLNNIGLIYDSLGEKRKALDYYKRALPVLRASDDRGTEAVTLVNMGLVYDSLGEKQKALDHYQSALTILRATADRAAEAVTLNNIGYVFDSLGEKEKALDYFGQALVILRAIGDSRVEAVTLNNIGYVYDSLGEKQKALDFYQQALPVLGVAGDRFKEAVTLNNIGLVQHSLGQTNKALDYFTRALRLRRNIGDRPGEAVTLSDTGMLYDSLGQTRKAIDYYNASLRLSRAVEDRGVEASTLRRLALAEKKRGNLAEARAKMESALALVESLRTNITGQELRASYFASIQQHFETYISILMLMHRKDPSRGYDGVALQQSERGRARSLLDMLTEARADIHQGVDPALLERERSLQQQLATMADRQTRMTGERQSAEQLTTAKKEVGRVLSEYQQVEAQIRIASPRYAALTQPVPLTLREIQQEVLDPDMLLLEYALGDEKSYLWAVTRTTLRSYELPPRSQIEGAARLVYQLLTARNQQVKFETVEEKKERINKSDKEYTEAAARLSRMLLGPVASGLEKRRLVIVSDGALNYVPFAALPAPERQGPGVRGQGSVRENRNRLPAPDSRPPLIVEHEIINLPSASTLAVLRREIGSREPAAKILAVIADPVFDKDDERVTTARKAKPSETRSLAEGAPGRHHGYLKSRKGLAPQSGAFGNNNQIQRLPFTRLEADEILELVPERERKRALDFDANRTTATSPELGQYRYVHFATHGVLNSEHPELSGIVLSLVNRDGAQQDGFLWAHEVFNLRLPAELVVLSGCRTGLGKEIKGEGLVGLTRGFMYAGAKRVVVSLWDISDEASAELMTQFYKGMLGTERLSPAAALRRAQIAVGRAERWKAPYYWAAFVLQGEAR